MKTIGIVGTRRRNTSKDFLAVKAALMKIWEPGDRLVSGGCPTGGDRFAEFFARDHLYCTIIIHYADWRKGKHAGFLRNTQIAQDADVLIACVASDRTGGTEDTIKKFESRTGQSAILVK